LVEDIKNDYSGYFSSKLGFKTLKKYNKSMFQILAVKIVKKAINIPGLTEKKQASLTKKYLE